MAKTTISKAIAAAQEAGHNAAHDWEPGSICNSDHRLRSLMNFERDVVKSTWDDTDALPQWNAFLQAYDAEASARDSGQAANKATSPLTELLKRIEAASLDLCDQSEIIKVAAQKVDEDDPAAVAALLRSIKSFNDDVFGKLEAISDDVDYQIKKGGAA